MAKGILDFENVKVEVNTIDKRNLVAIQVFYYADDYDNKPKCKEFLIDTKNDVLATGPMPKMILNIFNDKGEA